MRNGLRFALAAVLSVTLVPGTRAAGTLIDAVRRIDVGEVIVLLKQGASPDTRSQTGATALMYAAALSSSAVCRALLDAGADANAGSERGATALMWATSDVVKVRLLLDHGANPNAKTRDGSTALLAAARRGNVEAMRLLLARGADPGASAAELAELFRVGHIDRPEILGTLTQSGVDLGQLTRSGSPSVANYPVSNSEVIDQLVKMGADPNPRGRFPPLGLAVFQGHTATARVLLDHGADPNAKGQHGVTPLMMAAGASHPDPAIVGLLLERGADPAGRDDAGRTPLDWALTQDDGRVAGLIRNAGSTSTSVKPAPEPASRTRTRRAAVDAAVGRLRSISPVLYDARKCIACHHQTLPLLAMKAAAARGIAIDPDAVAHPIRSIVATWEGRYDDLMLGREVAGGANELTYGLVALAEARVPPNSATDAAVVNLLSLQRTDGSWVFFDTRPPQADNSPIPFTAMAIRGLEVYGPPGLRDSVKTSRARALRFLRSSVPSSTQDEAFKLLGLWWSHAPSVETETQAKRLLTLQRDSGGWAQMPTMVPDAYATGQALYALALSGMSPKHEAHQRGRAFLLRTQLEDGSWFVRSRAIGFQPYFESGFPHGPDQFISASATAWAVMGLIHGL